MSVDEEQSVSTTEVWHYTTAAGLDGIIRNNYLLAGPATQMNDSRELLEGYDFVRRMLSNLDAFDTDAARDEALGWLGTEEEVLHAADSVFSLSASSNGDNLSLWRAYGGDGSYAIKLDPDAPLLPIVNLRNLQLPLSKEEIPGLRLTEPYPHAAAKTLASWTRVDYETEFATELSEILRLGVGSTESKALTKEMMGDYRYDLFARVKHATFAAEQEVRKTFRVAPVQEFLSFITTGSGLKRFIRVGYPGGSDQSGSREVGDVSIYGCITTPERLPILEIKLSPTGHQPAAKTTLELFLSSHGYEDVPVSFSASPFTG